MVIQNKTTRNPFKNCAPTLREKSLRLFAKITPNLSEVHSLQWLSLGVNPFRGPEPLPILNPSNFVPKNGFPVVKGLRHRATKFRPLTLEPKTTPSPIYHRDDSFRLNQTPIRLPSEIQTPSVLRENNNPPPSSNTRMPPNASEA